MDSKVKPRSNPLRGQDQRRIRALGKPSLRTPRVKRSGPIASVTDVDSLFEDFLPYLIVKLAHELTLDLIEDLKPTGVNIVRWRILATLASNNGCTISEIGSRAMIQQSALSRMLMVMESEGYLTRRLKRGDERWVEVFLTARGQKQFEVLNEVVRRRQGRILAGLSEEEIATAFSVMRRLSDNVRGKSSSTAVTET
jgi:MarR family transcriptional regulator, organic hydroperoxide resistance regulator